MKNLLLFLSISFLIITVNAQTIQFNRLPGVSPILPTVADFTAADGISDVGDIDGDGDVDVIVSGGGISWRKSTIIYLNDGAGNYYKTLSQNLDSLGGGGVKLFDADGDNDLDLLIIGVTANNFYRSSFYKNDGSGNFTLQLNSSIVGMRTPDINVFDSDGDGDSDLLITGRNSTGDYDANLYLNDGTGIFSLSIGHPFSGVKGSRTDVADVNGDGKIDVIMRIEGFVIYTRLYLNTGTQYIENPLVAFNSNSGIFKFADADNDGDEDVLFFNSTFSQPNTSQLYLNNGSGNFTVSSLGLTGTVIIPEGIKFFDYDNDNDLDLIISGNISSSQDTTILYQNNSGVFTPIGNRGVKINGHTDLFLVLDYNNDNLKDLLVFGEPSYTARKSVLFKNMGAGQFKEVTGNSILGVSLGGVKFGDIDNDGDEDMIAYGYRDHYNSSTKIYLNNGSGGFVESTFTLPNMILGSLEMVDIDSDGDLDLAMVGQLGTYHTSTFYATSGVYLNNGLGQFSLLTSFTLPKLKNAKLKTGDFDNDGDIDIFHFGVDASYTRYANLYLNNGSASFTLNAANGISPSEVKDIEVHDFDNDGDLDFLIAGKRSSTRPREYVDLFLNDGFANFTAKGGVGFSNNRQANIGVGDMNQDGFLDAIIIGFDSNSAALTQVGINDGAGSFVLDTTHNFPMLKDGQVELADINNDNKIDVFIQGRLRYWDVVTNFYLNTGNGRFTKLEDSTLAVAYDGMLAFSDIDNDNDLDFAQFGFSDTRQLIGRIYNNECGSYRDTITTSVCDNFMWRGNTYTRSGEYFDTTANSNGCDSLHVLNLTILNNDSKISINSCVSYVWTNGRTYNQTGTYYDTLTNIYGCDSISELSLTIFQSNFTRDSLLVCGINYYNWNGDSLNVSGIYYDTLRNFNGCDSILRLDLRLEPFIILSKQDTSCQNYTWLRNGLTYNSSGMYSDTVKNSNSCDSIYILELAIGSESFRTDSVEACGQFFWEFNNKNYSEGGLYRDTINSRFGCDSIVELDLTLFSSSDTVIKDTACYSFYWIGNVLTNSGNYFDTLTNSVGCDSIIKLELIINKRNYFMNVDTLCSQYTWAINGNTYFQSGIYYDTISSLSDCDSINVLNLNLIPFDTLVIKNNFTLTSNQNHVFYQWIDCSNDGAIIPGATSRSYMAVKNGTYAVVVSSTSNCADTSQCVSITGVGINDVISSDEIKVYPNPSSEIVYIELLGELNRTGESIKVLNANGKLIEEIITNRKVIMTYRLKGLSAGIYFVKYRGYFKKIVIIK